MVRCGRGRGGAGAAAGGRGATVGDGGGTGRGAGRGCALSRHQACATFPDHARDDSLSIIVWALATWPVRVYGGTSEANGSSCSFPAS
eukprot:3953924-Prymnesium_polylepis.1